MQTTRVYADDWNLMEKLFVASGVHRLGENWSEVCELIKFRLQKDRPDDWFTPLTCELQFKLLRDSYVNTQSVIPPAVQILKKLKDECGREVERKEKSWKRYLMLKKKIEIFNKMSPDDLPLLDRYYDDCLRSKKRFEDQVKRYEEMMRQRNAKKAEFERQDNCQSLPKQTTPECKHHQQVLTTSPLLSSLLNNPPANHRSHFVSPNFPFDVVPGINNFATGNAPSTSNQLQTSMNLPSTCPFEQQTTGSPTSRPDFSVSLSSELDPNSLSLSPTDSSLLRDLASSDTISGVIQGVLRKLDPGTLENMDNIIREISASNTESLADKLDDIDLFDDENKIPYSTNVAAKPVNPFLNERNVTAKSDVANDGSLQNELNAHSSVPKESNYTATDIKPEINQVHFDASKVSDVLKSAMDRSFDSSHVTSKEIILSPCLIKKEEEQNRDNCVEIEYENVEICTKDENSTWVENDLDVSAKSDLERVLVRANEIQEDSVETDNLSMTSDLENVKSYNVFSTENEALVTTMPTDLERKRCDDEISLVTTDLENKKGDNANELVTPDLEGNKCHDALSVENEVQITSVTDDLESKYSDDAFSNDNEPEEVSIAEIPKSGMISSVQLVAEDNDETEEESNCTVKEDEINIKNKSDICENEEILEEMKINIEEQKGKKEEEGEVKAKLLPEIRKSSQVDDAWMLEASSEISTEENSVLIDEDSADVNVMELEPRHRYGKSYGRKNKSHSICRSQLSSDGAEEGAPVSHQSIKTESSIEEEDSISLTECKAVIAAVVSEENLEERNDADVSNVIEKSDNVDDNSRDEQEKYTDVVSKVVDDEENEIEKLECEDEKKRSENVEKKDDETCKIVIPAQVERHSKCDENTEGRMGEEHVASMDKGVVVVDATMKLTAAAADKKEETKTISTTAEVLPVAKAIRGRLVRKKGISETNVDRVAVLKREMLRKGKLLPNMLENAAVNVSRKEMRPDRLATVVKNVSEKETPHMYRNDDVGSVISLYIKRRLERSRNKKRKQAMSHDEKLSKVNRMKGSEKAQVMKTKKKHKTKSPSADGNSDADAKKMQPSSSSSSSSSPLKTKIKSKHKRTKEEKRSKKEAICGGKKKVSSSENGVDQQVKSDVEVEKKMQTSERKEKESKKSKRHEKSVKETLHTVEKRKEQMKKDVRSCVEKRKSDSAIKKQSTKDRRRTAAGGAVLISKVERPQCIDERMCERSPAEIAYMQKPRTRKELQESDRWRRICREAIRKKEQFLLNKRFKEKQHHFKLLKAQAKKLNEQKETEITENDKKVWKKTMMLAYRHMVGHKYAINFLKLVTNKDPKDIIFKQPMDFRTIKKKLDNNEIQSFTELQRDFYLIIANAKFYSSPDSQMYHMATEMQKDMEQWIRINAETLEEGVVFFNPNERGAMEKLRPRRENQKAPEQRQSTSAVATGKRSYNRKRTASTAVSKQAPQSAKMRKTTVKKK